MEATASSTSLELATINQFCQAHQAFTPGGLRWMIFNEKQNGLQNSGAIVMITSKNTQSDKFWAQQQGADGYVVKPFTRDQLLGEVQKFVR